MLIIRIFICCSRHLNQEELEKLWGKKKDYIQFYLEYLTIETYKSGEDTSRTRLRKTEFNYMNSTDFPQDEIQWLTEIEKCLHSLKVDLVPFSQFYN
jgi:hypothetical protein